MAVLSLVTSTEFVTIECGGCGVEFALRRSMYDALHRSHNTFHCPNGCSRAYNGKSDIEILRDKLATAEQEKANALKRKEWAEQAASKAEAAEKRAKAETKRLRKRAQNGACPCCKRTFSNLARHMAIKHPETPEAGKAAVAAEIEERETKRPPVKA